MPLNQSLYATYLVTLLEKHFCLGELMNAIDGKPVTLLGEEP